MELHNEGCSSLVSVILHIGTFRIIVGGIYKDEDVTISRRVGRVTFAKADVDARNVLPYFAVHTLDRASFRGLATASRLGLWSRPARRLRRGRIVRTALCWWILGRLALLCGHAGRVTLPAAVAGIPQPKAVRKADALAGVRPPCRVVGWRSGSGVGRMSADVYKYVRRCYIFRVVLCNRAYPTAQFGNHIATWSRKGGISIAA